MEDVDSKITVVWKVCANDVTALYINLVKPTIMGSGRKENRKGSDKVIIRTPKGGFPMGSGISIPDQVADVCPASMQVKVRQTPPVQHGVAVQLKKQGEGYAVILQGETIGTLSKRQSETMSRCKSLGIRYTGSIVIINGGAYARFSRVAE